MKKFILLLTFVFCIGFIEGQTTFFKTFHNYNEFGSYVEQTTDGGYVIIGTSQSTFNLNGLVIKTNSIGD
ncbi:MAG TPA: hypothetical protein VJI69_03700, partial [Bacteroidia bacterium]|nr:hypothetical protein [Bacteroidia bacterium]